MPEGDSKIGVAVIVAKELLDAAKESEDLKVAGKKIGKSLATIATTIENALLPLAALNFGIQKAKEYFSGPFQTEFAEKISEIPPENLVDPKPSVAGPALQGLTFALDEANLKEMYLNLLKTSVDNRISSNAHPSFVEVIKQLSSEDAMILQKISHVWGVGQIVRIKKNLSSGGYATIEKYVIEFFDPITKKNLFFPQFEKVFENWQRLGLVEADYSRTAFIENSYAWVENNPRFIQLKAECEPENNIDFERGVYEITKFGRSFLLAVGGGSSAGAPQK